jgi:ribose/xylose/arabinose/galactoside ABC-type transport system permease subunit
MVKIQVNNNKNKIISFTKKYGTIIGFFIIFIIFSLLSPNFLNSRNILNMLRQTSVLSCLAIGITIVLASGDFDLSVGNFVALIGVMLAGFFRMGFSLPIVIILSLALGLLAGAINGLLVTVIGIPAIIATLATGSIAQGFNYWFTKGYPIFEGITKSFLWIAGGYIYKIPVPVIIVTIVAIIMHFFLNFTKSGRHFYAIGGNRLAARYAGIKVTHMRIISYLISASTAAICAIILTSRLGSGQPGAGTSLTLEAYAAAFIGCSVIKEGQFHIFGTILGTLILSTLNNGLTILNVSYYMQNIVVGLVLITAVSAYSFQQKD